MRFAEHFFSERRIFRAKKVGGDGSAVRKGCFAVEIYRQAVRVKLFYVAIQLVAMNEHLRENDGRGGLKTWFQCVQVASISYGRTRSSSLLFMKGLITL